MAEIRRKNLNKECESLGGALEMLLKLPVMNEEQAAELERMGVPKGYRTNRMALAAALVQEAVTGEAKAVKLVLDLMQESEPERDEVEDLVRIVDDLQPSKEGAADGTA